MEIVALIKIGAEDDLQPPYVNMDRYFGTFILNDITILFY
jgi:hypothetical protein